MKQFFNYLKNAFFIAAVTGAGYFFITAEEENNTTKQEQNLIASGDMGGGGSSGNAGGGGTIDIDLGGDWGSGWGGGSDSSDPYINVYEPEYSEPHINIYEPEYSEPHINIYEPEYTPPVYTPPSYTPSSPPPTYAPPAPPAQPPRIPAPPAPRQALPLIILINDTPVVRVGDAIVIRIRILQGNRPFTIYWRIRGVNRWIIDGEIFRRRATRPGIIPITVIVKDKNGLYSQRQTTYVTVLKCQNCPVKKGNQVHAPVLPKQAPIQASTNTLKGCYDTDFGILHLTANGNQVTGSYDYLGGSTLTGTLQDNLLLGTWNEPAYAEAPAKSGPLQFVFTEGWKSFQGVWGNKGDDPLTGVWNGIQVKCPQDGAVSSIAVKKETLEQEEAGDRAGNAPSSSSNNIPDMEEPDYSQPLKEDPLPKNSNANSNQPA